MPNICCANIVVKGYKDNVDEFTRILNSDYNYYTMKFSHTPHFFRVFNAELYDEWMDGVIKTAYYDIECAWSVAVCMEGGPMSYYENVKKEYDQFYGTTLEETARRLGLFIEIHSKEEGMQFNEFIMYNNQGTKCIDLCKDTSSYNLNDYKSRFDFINKTGINISIDDYMYYMEEYEGYYARDTISDDTFVQSMQFPVREIVARRIK